MMNRKDFSHLKVPFGCEISGGNEKCYEVNKNTYFWEMPSNFINKELLLSGKIQCFRYTENYNKFRASIGHSILKNDYTADKLKFKLKKNNNFKFSMY